MLIWIGHTKGVEGWPNVPARDLSVEEVAACAESALLVALGLYAHPGKLVDEATPVEVIELWTPDPDRELPADE